MVVTPPAAAATDASPKPRDPLAAPGMDLAVDDAGEDQMACGFHGLRRFRRGTRAERADRAVPDREEALGKHAVGKHEVAAHDEVEHPSSPLTLRHVVVVAGVPGVDVALDAEPGRAVERACRDRDAILAHRLPEQVAAAAVAEPAPGDLR